MSECNTFGQPGKSAEERLLEDLARMQPKIGGNEKKGSAEESIPEIGKLRVDVRWLWRERDRLINESLRLIALGVDPAELEPIEGVPAGIFLEAAEKALNPLMTVTGNDPVKVTGNAGPMQAGSARHAFRSREKPFLPPAPEGVEMPEVAKEFITPQTPGYEWDENPRGKDGNPKDAIGSRKAGLSMLPRQVLYEVALGMLEGALKYARHNYRIAGVRASVYYDANSRHMDAWWEGQDTDPGSGLHHVVKAIASLVVLRDSMLAGNWQDDRPPSIGDPDWLDYYNKEAERIIDAFEGEPKQPFVKGDNE